MVCALSYTFFSLHIDFNGYCCAVRALGYSFINQSENTFKVTGEKKEGSENVASGSTATWTEVGAGFPSGDT